MHYTTGVAEERDRLVTFVQTFSALTAQTSHEHCFSEADLSEPELRKEGAPVQDYVYNYDHHLDEGAKAPQHSDSRRRDHEEKPDNAEDNHREEKLDTPTVALAGTGRIHQPTTKAAQEDPL